jgi:hypothetical protein
MDYAFTAEGAKMRAPHFRDSVGDAQAESNRLFTDSHDRVAFKAKIAGAQVAIDVVWTPVERGRIKEFAGACDPCGAGEIFQVWQRQRGPWCAQGSWSSAP